MDYYPTTQFMTPNVYFPEIDTAFRAAAFRGVKVRFLVAKWNHTGADMYQYLYSLNQLANIEVRLFIVPGTFSWRLPVLTSNLVR